MYLMEEVKSVANVAPTQITIIKTKRESRAKIKLESEQKIIKEHYYWDRDKYICQVGTWHVRQLCKWFKM